MTHRTAFKKTSIAFRLIAAAAVWTLLALVAGGWVLSNAFRASVEGDFDSEIQADMDSLVAAAGHDGTGRRKNR